MILKERLGVTDRELTEQIAENPYFQYFLGLPCYQDEAPFHHSMLTHFRKRFGQRSLEKINERIALKAKTLEASQDDSQDPPKGKLIVDATCAPADIKYPTDLNLLNKAREKTEAVIDRMHACRISDRTVSISQPHVRPIVRGKASAKVEFGAKISVSLIDGISFVDRIAIEGKFGEGKRRYGFSRIMAKPAQTSETMITSRPSW